MRPDNMPRPFAPEHSRATNEIADRIYRQRSDCIRRGLIPTSIYLGRETFDALRLGAGEFFHFQSAAKNQTFLGMTIYLVNDLEHCVVHGEQP